MTIREIEYAIRFWVEDYDGNEIAEEVFYDLCERTTAAMHSQQ